MGEFLRSFILVAPGIASEVTRHYLYTRKTKTPPAIRPEDPASSLSAYIQREKE